MRKWVVKPTSCQGGGLQGSMGSPGPQKLTDTGVGATNDELLRGAADVSGSQLTCYFPNKESLVFAVIDWQPDGILGFHRSDRSDFWTPGSTWRVVTG